MGLLTMQIDGLDDQKLRIAATAFAGALQLMGAKVETIQAITDEKLVLDRRGPFDTADLLRTAASFLPMSEEGSARRQAVDERHRSPVGQIDRS